MKPAPIPSSGHSAFGPFGVPSRRLPCVCAAGRRSCWRCRRRGRLSSDEGASSGVRSAGVFPARIVDRADGRHTARHFRLRARSCTRPLLQLVESVHAASLIQCRLLQASNLPLRGGRVQQKSRHKSCAKVALSVGHAARWFHGLAWDPPLRSDLMVPSPPVSCPQEVRYGRTVGCGIGGGWAGACFGGAISQDIPLGITRGMASDDYHAERSAVSSSQLKRMLVSPPTSCAVERTGGIDRSDAVRHRAPTAACWRAIHSRQRFFATPKVNRQTKARRSPGSTGQAAGRTMFLADWLPASSASMDNARMTQGTRNPGHRRSRSGARLDRFGDRHQVQGQDRLVAAGRSRTSSRRWTSPGGRLLEACARMQYALSAAMYCEGVSR